ncbi:MAG: ankyrin repeat domain-containing protein [Cytophagaceae bacterium]|jgi:hypothetical protein|nr:ankyrin repeat domain-containing protein [Cytophagaceae bacterium]
MQERIQQDLEAAMLKARDTSVSPTEQPKQLTGIVDCHPILCDLLQEESINQVRLDSLMQVAKPSLDCQCVIEVLSKRLGADIPIVNGFIGSKYRSGGIAMSPLAMLANDSRRKHLEKLIEYGATPSFAFNNSSALLFALENEQWKAAELLHKKGATLKDNYIELMRIEDLATAKKYYRYGADVNFTPENQSPPLFTMVDLDILRYFLEHGANASIQDSKGNSLLMYFSGRGFIEEMKVVLAFKPDLYVKNKSGETALHLAIQYEDAFATLYPLYDLAKAGIAKKELEELAAVYDNKKVLAYLSKQP